MVNGTNSSATQPWRGGASFVLSLAGLFLLLAFTLPKPWDPALERRIQARIDKGQSLRPEEHAARLLFWVALANAFGCVALGATARYWASRIPPEKEGQISADIECIESKNQVSSCVLACGPALFWSGLIILAGVAFWLRWPLASKSLWWDEAWALRHVIVGERLPDPEAPSGERFVRRNWARTVWYYAKPTNHVGFSILSRLCNDAWRTITAAPPWAFAEWAVRLPSLLSSVGAVVLIGVLGRSLLGGWGGLIAALILAVHPWFIRYGVDARAFGMNVLLSLSASLGFYRTLRTGGSWAPVILFGFSSFALILTFPYNFYLPTSFYLMAFVAALSRRLDWRVILRLAAAGILAAMFFIQVAAPWIPQAAAWTDVQGEDMAGPRLNFEGLAQTWASFTTGTSNKLEHSDTEDSIGIPSLEKLSQSMPLLPFYLWLLLPILFLGGATAMILLKSEASSRNAKQLLPAAWLLSVALPLLVAAWKQHYYYERYIIYALPGVILILVAGAMRITRFFPAVLGSREGLAAFFGFLLLTPLLAVQQPQRELLQQRPYSPARNVADFLTSVPSCKGLPPILLGYGLGSNVPALYNPHIRFAYIPSGLLDAMKEAVESGRQLLVFYGYSNFNRHNSDGNAKEAFTYLDDPSLFEQVAAFNGIEPAFYHRILRYSGKVVDPVLQPR